MSTPANLKATLLTLCAAFMAALHLDTSDKARADAADAENAAKDSTIADLKQQVADAKAQLPDLTDDEAATVDAALKAALAATPARAVPAPNVVPDPAPAAPAPVTSEVPPAA